MSTDVTPNDQPRLSEFVAEEVRVLMTRRKINNRMLALRLGVSDMWVSRRLRGTLPIDLNDLQRIASVLGVSATDLFPRQSGDIRRYPHTSDPLASRLVATIGEPKGRQRRPLVARGQRAVRLARPGIASRRRPVTPAIS